MLRLSLVLALLAGSVSSSLGADVPHFPGLQGHGANTVGGSGRHLSPPSTTVFTVNSLDDGGKGSLREAVEAKGPRTVVFGVSGTIVLNKPLVIENPFLTVAGQTAPKGGITLYGQRVVVKTHDVVLRHFGIYASDEVEAKEAFHQDCLVLHGAKNDKFASIKTPAKAPDDSSFNIVLDHLTLLWGVDENFSTYQACAYVTVNGCLIGEPLRYTKHPDIEVAAKAALDSGKKLHQPANHSMAFLVGPGNQYISVFETMITSSVHRNPRIMPGAAVEIVNCVVHNWGKSPADVVELSDSKKLGTATWLRLVGNTFQPGPDSTKVGVVNTRDAPPTTLLAADNVHKSQVFAPANANLKVVADKKVDPFIAISKFRSAKDAYPFVLKNVGARPWERGEQEERIIKQVKDGKGSFVDSPKDLMAGYPLNGKAQKALAEVTHKLPDNPFTLEKSGYTRLEEWMEKLVPAVPLK